MRRPIILILINHYLPGYKSGGPLRSIVNLIDSLSEQFDFRIICADRDLGDKVPYCGVTSSRWMPVGKALVYYMPPGLKNFVALARIIGDTNYDILYLNSFFSPQFSVLPLVARRFGLLRHKPLIIAPRGEFSSGALELKVAKKRAYIAFARIAGLLSDVKWQASSEHEAADIRKVLGTKARYIRVAMDLPAPLSLNPPKHMSRLLGEPLRVIFLSRISPMKNLDYALRVLSLVRSPIRFSIYGPAEDASYYSECKKLAAQLPDHVQVSWHGSVMPEDVPGVIAEHDLFFLPTRGENFGHVIAEALGAGTPALISDATPWRDLSKTGVGQDLPLSDPFVFAKAIDRMAATLPPEAIHQRDRVFAYALRRQRYGSDIEANRQLFFEALGMRDR